MRMFSGGPGRKATANQCAGSPSRKTASSTANTRQSSQRGRSSGRGGRGVDPTVRVRGTIGYGPSDIGTNHGREHRPAFEVIGVRRLGRRRSGRRHGVPGNHGQHGLGRRGRRRRGGRTTTTTTRRRRRPIPADPKSHTCCRTTTSRSRR
jgi:hypothetical protein